MTNSTFKIDASFVTITDDNNYNSFLILIGIVAKLVSKMVAIRVRSMLN